MALNPTHPEIDHNIFKKHKWIEFYGDVKESILNDMPYPRGKILDLRMHLDSNHDVDKATCWSRTEFLIFMNIYLIQWMSKKQPTIEKSVFGADIVVMKHGMKTLRGI